MTTEVRVRFPSELVEGRLIRRYKRFLADVELVDGRIVTAHVANSGSMMGLSAPGLRVFLSVSDDPKRKLAHALEIVEVDDGRGPTLVGINTARPNRIIEEAILAGAVPALAGYGALRREVRYGRNSRIDILLEGEGRPPAHVEVKNVHLVRRPGLAEFPDSVTTRGAKHLDELADVVAGGGRAVMVYLVHRDDCDRLAFAADLDPGYANAFRAARARGVEAIALTARVTREGTAVIGGMPIEA